MWGPPGYTSVRGTGWEQYTVSSSDTVREYEVSDVQTEKCHQICLNLDDGIRTAVLSNF